ncbi:hypothetical protein [Streptomyces sp. MZ04]|uniref:DUF6919 domain-containing protein n=1 Tax=Streptomyces sp. MZ04 TaxID=2559236 RepID=UPI00107E7915|nr:hypothetical protein [Streptomyces sp. MZ04]TGB06540.1 hypothetical protein E2651_23290 [Streptomyces sp. MZ04]
MSVQTDLSAWSEARSLADLGILMAGWYEGRVPEWPGREGRPDEGLYPAADSLAAACRAGIVVLSAQPASVERVDGELWIHRATFTALVERDDLSTALLRGAREAGLVRYGLLSSAGGFGWPNTVTARDGEPMEFAGHRIDAADVAHMFDGCHADAVRAAVDAWQVTLIDPGSARDGLLWKVLDAASGRTEAGVA